MSVAPIPSRGLEATHDATDATNSRSLAFEDLVGECARGTESDAERIRATSRSIFQEPRAGRHELAMQVPRHS